jgi:hypothetical protein
MLVVLLLFLLLVVLRDVVVSVFPAVIFGRLLHAVGFLAGVDLLFFLHDPDGFFIVEAPLLLVVLGVAGGRLFALLGVVALFFMHTFWSVVGLLVAPADGEGAGAAWSLHDLFVGLSVEVCVVSYVFIKHLCS